MKRARRPRVTSTDPEFSEAVIHALDAYRDRTKLRNQDLAERLGISKATLSKYLSGTIQIGGPVLARAFVTLGIEVRYRGRLLCARDLSAATNQLPSIEQIQFEFTEPYSLDKTGQRLNVTVECRKGADSDRVIAMMRLLA